MVLQDMWQIKITADVETGGSIKVSVLNNDDRKIATSKPITKTCTNETLEFNNSINEGNIRLKIELSKVKVYSFSIDN
jgi:hypothetical protein